MILEFKFKYLLDDGVMEFFLNESAKKSSLKYFIIKNDDFISLFAEGSEEQLIEFSQKLSLDIPISIFLESSEVKVVATMPETSNLPICHSKFFLTPQILELSKELNSIFINPDLSIFESNIAYDIDEINLKSNNYKEIFSKVADDIKDGKRIKIQTFSENFCIGKLDENSQDELKNQDFYVMPTDFSLINKIAVASKDEAKTLATLEKPKIKLKVNLIFANKKFLSCPYVELKMADDLILHYLTKELFERNVEFCYLIKSEEEKINLKFDGLKQTKKEDLKVSVLDFGILLLNGYKIADKTLLTTYNKIKIPKFAHFTVLMQEKNLLNQDSFGFFLSQKNDDGLMYFDQKIGLIEFTKVILPTNGKEILDEINKDETGSRLLENYKSQFADFYENLNNLEIPKTTPSNFFSIFGIVGVALGFSKDMQKAGECILENVENFGGKKGPSIDYKLKEGRAFDITRIIRSAMSFKLAGVDENILCYGFIESLMYFMSDLMDSQKENFASKNVCFCGSMFAYKKLSNLCFKNISINHNVFFNTKFPIDS